MRWLVVLVGKYSWTMQSLCLVIIAGRRRNLKQESSRNLAAIPIQGLSTNNNQSGHEPRTAYLEPGGAPAVGVVLHGPHPLGTASGAGPAGLPRVGVPFPPGTASQRYYGSGRPSEFAEASVWRATTMECPKQVCLDATERIPIAPHSEQLEDRPKNVHSSTHFANRNPGCFAFVFWVGEYLGRVYFYTYVSCDVI